MRKYKDLILFITILLIGIVVGVIPSFMNDRLSKMYYPDTDTAVENYGKKFSYFNIDFTTEKPKGKNITIIEGEEGIVCFSISPIETIWVYNFDTRIKNENTEYKVAQFYGISEPLIAKIRTALGSNEQILYGIDYKTYEVCYNKTGKEGEFVHFEYNENWYSFWYIISPNGFNELSDMYICSPPEPTIWVYIVGYLIAGVCAVFIYIFYDMWRNQKRKQNPTMKG